MPREPDEDVLARLEERLQQATSAAERLWAEATRAIPREQAEDPRGNQGERRPPPAGWQFPRPGGDRPATPDLDALVEAFTTFRELIPPELQRRVVEALRELLLAVRALIDWYLDRLDRRRREPAEVQDIPIL
jgi:hypothetical protein